MANFIALIVAAGKGKRYGGAVPKQYELLDGEAVLWHSVQAFLRHPRIDGVCVVISAEDEERFLSLGLPVKHCIGGDERQDSVRLGLESLAEIAPKNVLIHDAARPFVSHEVISAVLEKLTDNQAVVPVTSCADSIRYEGNPLARENLKFVQTPQGFDFKMIIGAHNQQSTISHQPFTDDAQIAEAAGAKIAYCEGDARNIKITTRVDMEGRAATAQTCIGMGFDVHAFCDGDGVKLCGVSVPHDRALAGHSDADVALHALTDAVLGAIGEGDIGEHFPPTQPQWAGMDSSFFLAKALILLASKQGRLVNVDLTIICEEPKVSPHKVAMRKNLAKLLDLPIDRVNIKATTTEKLGFTGRGEGIAAQAVASVEIFK